MHKHDEDYNTGRHGAVVGIVTNTLLFGFKLFAGIFGRSHAMMADALHTATDSITSIGVFIGFKIAQKPPDEEHPYGHGRAESIAAKIVSLVLILGGLKVAFDSSIVIINRDFHVPLQVALWAAVISIVIKEWLFRYTYRIGNKIQSNSLKSDAWHHRSDALSSIAALIGITGARMGYPILDPIAGLAVSVFVIKAGLRLLHTAYDELMDAALPKKTLEKIRELSGCVEGVKRIKDLKGRKMGIEIFIDMTIEVDKSMSVEEAHLITVKIRRSCLNNIQGAKDIFIHVEPFN
ncbi:MAG: cation transporter [Candidatus Omnitrophica bacterium]|nr:cation transporter [Candidatus Omnitrophota bacterium]